MVFHNPEYKGMILSREALEERGCRHTSYGIDNYMVGHTERVVEGKLLIFTDIFLPADNCCWRYSGSF